MKCPSCNADGVLVENLGEGRKRVRCSRCGLNEVKDGEGRKLLNEVPSREGPLLG